MGDVSGNTRVELPDLPRVGGSIRAEVNGAALAFGRLVYDAKLAALQTKIELIPDRARFRLGRAKDALVRLDGLRQDLVLEVIAGVGSVQLTTGAIDDQPVRISLIPEEGEEADVFTRHSTTVPRAEAKVQAWVLETVGQEVAAIAIRPGSSYLFDGVPDGRYIVAVQTGLDLSPSSIFVDPRAASTGPLARRIEVKSGEITDVTVAPGDPMAVTLTLRLDKAAQKQLKKRMAKEGEPTALARECVSSSLTAEPADGEPSVPLQWTHPRRLAGTLEEGLPYIVHISGLGDIDSAHVITPRKGKEIVLRLDALIEIEVSGGKNRSYEIELIATPSQEGGRPMNYDLPPATLTRKPKRGKLQLTGLSPLASHRIVIRQQGKRAEITVAALADDSKAETDKRSKALVRSVKVTLR